MFERPVNNSLVYYVKELIVSVKRFYNTRPCSVIQSIFESSPKKIVAGPVL